MKSELTETVENEYPILKINETKTIIVMFLAPKKGVIVYSEKEGYQIGGVDHKWDETVSFTEYKGTVKLSN